MLKLYKYLILLPVLVLVPRVEAEQLSDKPQRKLTQLGWRIVGESELDAGEFQGSTIPQISRPKRFEKTTVDSNQRFEVVGRFRPSFEKRNFFDGEKKGKPVSSLASNIRLLNNSKLLEQVSPSCSEEIDFRLIRFENLVEQLYGKQPVIFIPTCDLP